ncbi:hypothetical protein G3545_01175 [Starkeya sp. ORNL1]|uniref:hypothetical protein n=1 Tax=Starkeya sp. ORNL1 TaxID=2709380 RepID=UPI00146377DF|nr:hypothetical protein [Starkeya sp. ORNL1]QJP12395.1 hypothetical protein G3545_01175 [Starkeya sp. ORNL1]
MSKASVSAVVALLSAACLLAPTQEAKAWRAGACGPNGCVGAAGPGVYRGPYRAPAARYYGPPRGVVVVNPRRYWVPGGAVAAGAAIGFVAGATAVAVAGSPPKPNYCWYYTNPARTTGFWEPCPR